jgi:hypothetical protein
MGSTFNMVATGPTATSHIHMASPYVSRVSCDVSHDRVGSTVIDNMVKGWLETYDEVAFITVLKHNITNE